MPLKDPTGRLTVVHLLHRAGRQADAAFDRATGGFSPRRMAILEAVSRKNGLSQTDITSATGIDRSSTASMVREMVRDGLVQRRRTKRDNRMYSVRLTDKGRDVLNFIAPRAEEVDTTLLALLSRQERTEFLNALIRIASAGQTSQTK